MSEGSRSIDVDLWVWPLDIEGPERARLAALLSTDEQARAGRFIADTHRERFIAARGRLREILAQLLACGPRDVRFSYSAHGKPTLAGVAPPLRFNLSHSEGIGALAVSTALDLGVDVEAVRPFQEGLPQRFFSRREVEALAVLPAADQLDGFYRCWTRKEAVIKAIGEGLSRPLDSFDVSVAETPALLERLDEDTNAAREWQLANFDPAPGYIGAVACRTGGAPIALRRRDLWRMG